ncbi:hypothetical protein niasHS_004301 [Heterodera schachtii]|uniref:MATH domain-containing protein n=1 Tax=Heterodera schachtii TaxID=97005 RepID=A0ABD2JUY0_HETSC
MGAVEYINGLSWKIWAKIKTKTGNTDDNEKWLSIYLLCDAPEEDLYWHCIVRSATFRIISRKNGVDNSIGTVCDRVLNNKSTGLGFVNFISFAELMDQSNGFYNREENKVTLTIDLTVKDEKMDKFDLDQSKSNEKISMEIEKLSEFAREAIGSERKSETATHIKGLPWKIWAQKKRKNGSTDNNEKWLGFYLLCAGPKEDKTWECKDKTWECKCSATFRIVSPKNNMGDYWREFSEERTFNSKSNSTWGYDNFISFAELMDPSKGFYNKSEDKITLAIDVTVKEAKTEGKS